MNKKKHQGHYCYVCAEYKPNEKFSGKGHANHICKDCSKLTVTQRNEKQKENKIEFEPFNNYEEQWEYDIERMIVLEDLDNENKEILREDIYDLISEFILYTGYIPEKHDKQRLITTACCPDSYSDKFLIQNDSLGFFFDEILQSVVKDFKEDGFVPESYLDTLVVFETERLKIRKFVIGDLRELHDIMEKEKVMYAWEHGFTKDETKRWLNGQIKRYRKDSYGYFAVILKKTGSLIGQTGLFKSEIGRKEVVELGYIFDNLYWKHGYCIESVVACIRFASDTLKLNELYCSIRPENENSIRIAEKIGMTKTGEHIKIYMEKEMLHFIYRLTF
jgi:RimJ/RimL family protein N-acetyltransferase